MQASESSRQRWPGQTQVSQRVIFVMAAVGSAVGLGNVWRFPYLVAKYGGGAFLIPYTICLVMIGMPILLMELALGQKFQGGDVEAFGKLNPRLRGIGLASIWGAGIIISYYAMVIGWAVIYSFRSLKWLPWTTVPKARDYFYGEVIQP
eukprot:UN13285